MEHNILSLFQICDSNFPTGSFSHSYGLESYIQEGVVHNLETFQEWLQVYLNEQLVYSDGLASHLIYPLLEQADLHEVWKIDRLITVQNLPRETREGTKFIGERMLKLTELLYGAPILTQYRERIENKQSFGHPAIVFTMVAQHLGISRGNCVLYYLYSVVSSLVQNAVRAIPLGQTAGQTLMHDFQNHLVAAVSTIQHLDEEDFGIVSPGLELSQMKHERVNIRIFMS